MLGFAILDRAPDTAEVVVWLTTKLKDARVDHTNAVVVSLDNDPEALRKIHGLTRDRVVMLTPGTTKDGLPLSAETLSPSALDLLVDETATHREDIIAAVKEYRRHARKPAIKLPDFPRLCVTYDFSTDASQVEQALSLADLVAQLWSQWLATDEERRRRTKDRDRVTPWMMPEEMNQPGLVLFPPAFGALLRPQPLEPYRA